MLSNLTPGRYLASGAYQPGPGPTAGFPLEWSAKFTRDGGLAVFDGTYRHHRGKARHPFRVDIFLPHDDLGRGRFELRCPYLDLVRGPIRVVEKGVVFAGRSDGRAASVTLNLESPKPGTFDAKGALHWSKDAPWIFWFSATALPSASKIVDIQSRGD